MDSDTRLILLALCGGLLGWALGSLIDLYLPSLQVTKSKPALVLVVVLAVCAIFWLKLGRLPQL